VEIRSLSDSELFRKIPLSYRICRVYAETTEHNAALAAALLQAGVFALFHGSLPAGQPLMLQVLLIIALYPVIVRLILSPVNAGLPQPEPV